MPKKPTTNRQVLRTLIIASSIVLVFMLAAVGAVEVQKSTEVADVLHYCLSLGYPPDVCQDTMGAPRPLFWGLLK